MQQGQRPHWRTPLQKSLQAICCCFLLLCKVLLAMPAGAITGDGAYPKHALTQYKVDVWQTEQGLPLNTVQALLQTHDGYLWVGTGGGLARFDGVRFATFDTALAPEMVSQAIFGFMEDAQHNLWIGHSNGAAIYRNGVFQTVISSELTASKRVWAFVQDASGVVWAATENGLVRWDKGAIRLYQQADGLPTNRLRSLALDRQGVLWIGTSGAGLVSFSDGKFRVFNPENGFPHLEVRYVLADPDGGVWAATAGAGLVHVQDGAIKTYTVADGLPTDQLTSLDQDAQGALWIGTWGGGVSRMVDGRFTSTSAAGGLSGEQIWPIHVDREGSVWVGTWLGGLNRLRNRGFVVFGKAEGLSHDNVRAVLHARDGVTWVSTAGGGLNRIEGGKITTLRKKDGLPTDEISTLYEDREGAIWIGTYTSGVTRLRQGRLDVFGMAQGLPNAEIRSLLQDKAGTLWVGTRSGLARFNGTGFTTVRDEGAPPEGVSVMLEDRSADLWFGTMGQGLYRLHDGKFTKLDRSDGMVSNWVLSLFEDTQGSLWIGSNGQGIGRLHRGKVSIIRPMDGLWDGAAQTLLEDAVGYLWVTGNRGFYRVSRTELDAFAEGKISKVISTGYGPGDALRSTSFAGGLQSAGAIDAQGLIWLPSANGLVIVDPLHLPGSGDPPSVNIENVVVDGVDNPGPTEVVLPAGSVPLSIRYTAMTLANADRVRFRYQLDGMTHDWVDAGRNREAAFPALPHGRYRFRVAASIDGKQWSAVDGALQITVKPFFYQTTWFLVVAVLASVGGMVVLFRLRTRSLQARHAEMERLVAQRTEELRLANAHLSRLSFVDGLTGLANRRRFDEALDQEWRRASRAQTALAIVMADIDFFKLYNDTRGHLEGDRCLTAIAQIFLQSVGRVGDLAARYGGEEFVVLIPGADLAAATHFAQSLRGACEARAIAHPASPVSPVVTISVGVASCTPSDDVLASSLLEQADAALYRAKLAGRNRVVG